MSAPLTPLNPDPVPRTLEPRRSQEVTELARQQWLEENREAIEAYNREIEQRGCFADSVRSF